MWLTVAGVLKSNFVGTQLDIRNFFLSALPQLILCVHIIVKVQSKIAYAHF